MYKVELTETELRYLFGIVAEDMDEFSKSLENQNNQRSRFTEDGLNELFNKLNPDVLIGEE